MSDIQQNKSYILRSLLSLLLLFFVASPATSVTPSKPTGPEFFVRVVPQKKEVVKGDSTIVSIIVYSSADLQSVTCKSEKELKIKGCRVRKVSNDNGRRVVQTRLDGKVYYALVWARYMVASDEIGEYNIPELSFEGVVRVYSRTGDDFFGFFGRTTYKDHKMKATSLKTKLPFVQKQQKTTDELLHSHQGGVL